MLQSTNTMLQKQKIAWFKKKEKKVKKSFKSFFEKKNSKKKTIVKTENQSVLRKSRFGSVFRFKTEPTASLLLLQHLQTSMGLNITLRKLHKSNSSDIKPTKSYLHSFNNYL